MKGDFQMLNFRKRLELIEEKKKDELARIERKLDVVIEEVFLALEKISYIDYSKVKSIIFSIDTNDCKVITVRTQNNIFLLRKEINDTDIFFILKILHEKLISEKVSAKFLDSYNLEVKIKE